jgi:hypothetical protein
MSNQEQGESQNSSGKKAKPKSRFRRVERPQNLDEFKDICLLGKFFILVLFKNKFIYHTHLTFLVYIDVKMIA